jgi:hypothetical protein
MMAQPIQTKNPTWSRDELILALDLYACFKGNPPGKGSSAVVELSNVLNEMGAQIANRASDFRNPNGVYALGFMLAFDGRGHDLVEGGLAETFTKASTEAVKERFQKS